MSSIRKEILSFNMGEDLTWLADKVDAALLVSKNAKSAKERKQALEAVTILTQEVPKLIAAKNIDAHNYSRYLTKLLDLGITVGLEYAKRVK